MKITRKEYNKALDLVEEYHKQLLDSSERANKTDLLKWEKFKYLPTRTRRVLSEVYETVKKYDKKPLYLEDLTWEECKKYRNFGWVSWTELEEIRGY